MGAKQPGGGKWPKAERLLSDFNAAKRTLILARCLAVSDRSSHSRTPNMRSANRSAASISRAQVVQRLVHAHKAGEVGQTFGDAELVLDAAIDPPSHPACDRAVDGGRELEPADEGVRNFIGKVPAVAGVEEVTGRLIRTGGGIADGLHRERPGWMRLGVMPDPAEEAPILILARQGC